MKFRITLLIALFFLSHPASAACLNLDFGSVPSLAAFQGGNGGYSVYENGEYLQTVSFTVQAEAAGGICEYFVALSAGQSNDFSQRVLSDGINTLNYNAWVSADKTGILKEPPNATDEEVVKGTFSLIPGLEQTNEHEFVWTIDPAQIVPASDMPYEDTSLTLSLYSGLPLFAPTFVTSRTITFRARVESSVDLSLVDSGAPFDIGNTTQSVDFGTLESGEQLAFDLIIRSNSGYAVTMQSENNQTLLHASSAVTGRIVYDLLIDGASVDLSSGAPVQVLSDTVTTPATGIVFPVEFSIETLTGREAAGTYSDVITVDVTAN